MITLILIFLWSGWGPFSNTRELGASCHDGKGFRAPATTYGGQSWVRKIDPFFFSFLFSSYGSTYFYALCCCSRRAEKYFRRGMRLDWPEGATSRESMRAVWKLPRLPVVFSELTLFILLVDMCYRYILSYQKDITSIIDHFGCSYLDS